MKSDLTEQEWQELVSLDYVLTWNYSDNYERDLERYRFLSDTFLNTYKRFNSTFSV